MNVDEVLNAIRSQVGEESLSDSCKRDGCRVSLESVPSPSRRVLVDADSAFPAHAIEGKRCDYVLFFIKTAPHTLLTVPIELKSGGVNSASEVSEQLQSGAEFAERFAPEAIESLCRPVLFHGRKIHQMELKRLNRFKIHFRGYPLTIQTARCNRPKNLASALGDDVIKSLQF